MDFFNNVRKRTEFPWSGRRHADIFGVWHADSRSSPCLKRRWLRQFGDKNGTGAGDESAKRVLLVPVSHIREIRSFCASSASNLFGATENCICSWFVRFFGHYFAVNDSSLFRKADLTYKGWGTGSLSRFTFVSTRLHAGHRRSGHPRIFYWKFRKIYKSFVRTKSYVRIADIVKWRSCSDSSSNGADPFRCRDYDGLQDGNQV